MTRFKYIYQKVENFFFEKQYPLVDLAAGIIIQFLRKRNGTTIKHFTFLNTFYFLVNFTLFSVDFTLFLELSHIFPTYIISCPHIIVSSGISKNGILCILCMDLQDKEIVSRAKCISRKPLLEFFGLTKLMLHLEPSQ